MIYAQEIGQREGGKKCEEQREERSEEKKRSWERKENGRRERIIWTLSAHGYPKCLSASPRVLQSSVSYVSTQANLHNRKQDTHELINEN